jgi:hypothetical protein
MFVASAATERLSSELSGVSVPAMLLLPTVGLMAQMYARWMAREEPERMRAFLMQLFEATTREDKVTSTAHAARRLSEPSQIPA